jgi:hypothetical protein
VPTQSSTHKSTYQITVIILLTLAALTTFLGHRNGTEAALMQSRASDQWSEYQAKKVRADNLAVTLELLDTQPTTDPAATAAKRKDYEAHIEKWRANLNEEQEKAREFESWATHAEAEASRFNMGAALLQIAFVVHSYLDILLGAQITNSVE